MKKKIMNNEKMNQIIDDAWTNYQRKVLDKFMNDTTIANYAITNKEEFINKCKTDSEFSEKWGLKIEEREVLNQVDQTNPVLIGSTALYPHKLITITYNNETIESYECKK